jgi:hypothetical protein
MLMCKEKRKAISIHAKNAAWWLTASRGCSCLTAAANHILINQCGPRPMLVKVAKIILDHPGEIPNLHKQGPALQVTWRSQCLYSYKVHNTVERIVGQIGCILLLLSGSVATSFAKGAIQEPFN